jgi:hypothetical protein
VKTHITRNEGGGYRFEARRFARARAHAERHTMLPSECNTVCKHESVYSIYINSIKTADGNKVDRKTSECNNTIYIYRQESMALQTA